MHIGFDRGDAGVECDLKTGKGVFRLKTAGAAMALQIEAFHREERGLSP